MHQLYEDFYQEKAFVSHLVDFLKRYDKDHAIRMLIAFLGSLAFCLVAAIWPSDIVEVTFAVVCVCTLLYRGFFHSFEAHISKNPNLKPYFE